MINSRAVEFSNSLIPQTPKDTGVAGLAALTALFYSAAMGMTFYAGYIGYKRWTRIPPAESCIFDALPPTTTYARRELLRGAYLRNCRPRNIDPREIEQILMPGGKFFGQSLHSMTGDDSRKVPRPYRFFDLLISPYKPLGYWGLGHGFGAISDILPSEATLQWVISENDKIAENRRLTPSASEMKRKIRSRHFYNEKYLKNLLELNFYIFDQHQTFRENIFDKRGRVKEGGIEYFIRHHWDVQERKKEDAPLLALVHAAFGDEALCREGPLGENIRYLQLIKIPDEPGLRDVIHLHQQFPNHEWKTIQALLRTFNDINVVRDQLQSLVPGKRYYTREDFQIVPEDASCIPLPIFIRLAECRETNPHPHNYVIKGSGSSEDPYSAELFQET